jgi:DNA polymerase-4
LHHAELFSLAIAHIDCDAFYASIEKRDHPELAQKPVIIGGSVRGVVATACYIARLSGVKSAMPMATAKKLCPDAIILPPDFAKYHAEAIILRQMMEALTPLFLPLSIDEAVLDLSGTETLHQAPPALMLARLAARIEQERGITVSIGLSHNRMLARIAASLDKPRGFSVLGAEAPSVLTAYPIGILPGVGNVRGKKLAERGFTRIGQLQTLTARDARHMLGEDGAALIAAANGIDERRVDPLRAKPVSLSAETTFAEDLADIASLERALWHCCEKLASRLSAAGLAASGIMLKLKTADFRARTRNARLAGPSLVPDVMFAAAKTLLAREADGTKFRLIGIAAAPLADAACADQPDLADPDVTKRAQRHAAIRQLREKFGANAVQRGLGFRPDKA